MKKLFLIMLAFLLIVSFNSLAAEYPNQDIKMICGYGVGGGCDAITRMISATADKLLPTSIYVVNVEGAASGIGSQEVMDSKPDGYTLGTFYYDSIITVPRQKLIPTYDLNRLKMICAITSEPDALMVRSDSKWKTIDDLINDAKARPGEITIGTSGVGSGEHISVLMMKKVLGTEFNAISYPGGSGSRIEALLSGELDVAVGSLGDFSAVISSGKARALVELSTKRNPAFPDVPNFKELGYEGIERGSFVIVGAPSETPDEIVNKLEKVFYDAQHSDEFRNWLKSIGVSDTYYGMSEVTEWAMKYQEEVYKMLDTLVAQGVIKE